MRLRNMLGEEVGATLATDRAESSHGIPVLVVEGEALGPAETAGLVLLDATEVERRGLARAGYRIPAG